MSKDRDEFKRKAELALDHVGVKSHRYSENKAGQSWCFIYNFQKKSWPLRLFISMCDMSVLPAVYWDDPTPKWLWPHTSINGAICFSDAIGLEFDSENLSGVFEWVLNQACELLSKNHGLSLTERSLAFADELESYVRQFGGKSVMLKNEVSGTCSLYVEVSKSKAKTGISVPQYIHVGQYGGLKKTTRQTIGLVKISISQLPSLTLDLDATWWKCFFSRLTPEQKLSVDRTKIMGVVVQVENGFGGALLFLYWGASGRKNTQCSLNLYYIQKQYRDYLIERFGGVPINTRVLVAGIGAVGSRVAEFLALAGVRELVFFDKDRFEADNLMRHVLGVESISKYKVDAITDNLKGRVEGVCIEPVSDNLTLEILASMVGSIDVVVLATGNPHFERMVVRTAFDNGWEVLIVSAFVEAAGLGGHAISMRPGQEGCIECLYIDDETCGLGLSFSGSLIEENQVITQHISGCGGFAPFSSIDATKTALNACEIVLENKVCYKRWVGSDDAATRLGIAPSETYYQLRGNQLPRYLEPNLYKRPECICCTS